MNIHPADITDSQLENYCSCCGGRYLSKSEVHLKSKDGIPFLCICEDSIEDEDF